MKAALCITAVVSSRVRENFRFLCWCWDLPTSMLNLAVLCWLQIGLWSFRRPVFVMSMPKVKYTNRRKEKPHPAPNVVMRPRRPKTSACPVRKQISLPSCSNLNDKKKKLWKCLWECCFSVFVFLTFSCNLLGFCLHRNTWSNILKYLHKTLHHISCYSCLMLICY